MIRWSLGVIDMRLSIILEQSGAMVHRMSVHLFRFTTNRAPNAENQGHMRDSRIVRLLVI